MNNLMSRINSGLVIALVTFSTASFAEVVNVPVSKQATAQVEKPKLGQSMAQVEAAFGQPIARSPAVGEPPITRWRYTKYTVYFEHNIVIHAVTHKS